MKKLVLLFLTCAFLNFTLQATTEHQEKINDLKSSIHSYEKHIDLFRNMKSRSPSVILSPLIASIYFCGVETLNCQSLVDTLFYGTLTTAAFISICVYLWEGFQYEIDTTKNKQLLSQLCNKQVTNEGYVLPLTAYTTADLPWALTTQQFITFGYRMGLTTEELLKIAQENSRNDVVHTLTLLG